MIIDTGMNREECKERMFGSLESSNVDLEISDFFITHLHADHLGLVGALASENSKIYFNETEASYFRPGDEDKSDGFQEMFSYYRLNGFPEDKLEEILKRHPGSRFSPGQRLDFKLMGEGDKLDVGDYSFECIETPGHSPGHMCLYERNEKILVSGDHILFDITPNITWWPIMDDPLGEYLESLDKVFDLDVDLVLPGHRSIQGNHRRRVRELQEHHENRLDEVLSALENGEKTAWEIAPKITWDIEFDCWEELPITHKWFATGETIAHLIYLRNRDRVQKAVSDGKILYSRV